MTAKKRPNQSRTARTRRQADWRTAVFFRPNLERLEDRRVLAWYNADLPADVNDDGSVASNDVFAMVSVLRSDPDLSITIGPEDPLPPEGYVNANNDSVVNFADFEVVLSAYEAIFGELEVTWESQTLPTSFDFTVSGGDVTEPVEGVAQMTFTVTLNGPQDEEISLAFLVSSEAAIYGLDFANVTGPGGAVPDGEIGELVLSPGAISASVTVDILADDLSETAEAIFIQVGCFDILHDASGSILDSDEQLPPPPPNNHLYATAEFNQITEGDVVDLYGLLQVESGMPPSSVLIKDSFGVTLGEAIVAGDGTFDWTYPVPDDNPTTTPQDMLTFVVVPNDGGSLNLETNVSLTVNNAPPEATADLVHPTDPELPGDIIGDGGDVLLLLRVTDLGVDDSFTVQIDWGDTTIENPPVPSNVSAGEPIPFLHHYEPTGGPEPTTVYPIKIIVTDDDSGTTEVHTSVVAEKAETTNKPEVWIEAVDGNANEVNQETGSFRVLRSGSTASALHVKIRRDGDATFTDFTWDKISSFSTVTIPAGQDSVLVTVTPKTDVGQEGLENLIPTIRNYNYPFSTPYSIRTGQESTTIAIADGWGLATIRALAPSREEDADFGAWNAIGLKYEVTFWGGATPSAWSVDIPLEYSGDAVLGEDYTTDLPNSALLHMHLDDLVIARKVFRVRQRADGDVEPNESVVIAIGTNEDVSPVPGSQPASAMIVNDDSAATVSIVANHATVNEDDNVNAVSLDYGRFTISRSGPTTFPLWVSFGVSGGATRGEDYLLKKVPSPWHQVFAGSYVIPAGRSTVGIGVFPSHDRLTEGNETVVIQLEDNANSVVDSAQPSATMTIVDNDAPANHWVFVKEPSNPGTTWEDWSWKEDWTAQNGGYWRRVKEIERYEVQDIVRDATNAAGLGLASKPFTYSLGSSHQVTVGFEFYVQGSYTFTPGTPQVSGDQVVYVSANAPGEGWILGYQWRALTHYVIEQRIFDPDRTETSTQPLGLTEAEVKDAAGDQYVDWSHQQRVYTSGNIAIYKRQE